MDQVVKHVVWPGTDRYPVSVAAPEFGLYFMQALHGPVGILLAVRRFSCHPLAKSRLGRDFLLHRSETPPLPILPFFLPFLLFSAPVNTRHGSLLVLLLIRSTTHAILTVRYYSRLLSSQSLRAAHCHFAAE